MSKYPYEDCARCGYYNTLGFPGLAFGLMVFPGLASDPHEDICVKASVPLLLTLKVLVPFPRIFQQGSDNATRVPYLFSMPFVVYPHLPSALSARLATFFLSRSRS